MDDETTPTEPTKMLNQTQQIEVASELQSLILQDFVKIIKNNTASATDRATIVRLLRENGWTLDPAQIPSSLKDKLTRTVRFDEDLSESEAGEKRRLRAI
jgi:hypothetical protein